MIYLVSGRVPYETCFTYGAFLTKEKAIDRLHELQSIIPGEFEDTVYYSIDAIELDR